MNITAHQIEIAIKEATEFNLTETLDGAFRTIDNQFERGLIDEWEVEYRKEDVRDSYTTQQEQANEILALIDGYRK